jgi:host factor-I protein
MGRSFGQQGVFLEALRESGTQVSVFLLNGVKLQGQIDSFDRFVVRLKNDAKHQVVYKHTISAITPMVDLKPKGARLQEGIAEAAAS